MKKNKLKSIEGIEIACFECVYSPAKRRGPVPGKIGQVRKAPEPMHDSSAYSDVVASAANGNVAAATAFGAGIGGATPGMDGGFVGASADEQQQLLALQQQRQMMLAAAGSGNANLLGLGGALGAATGEVPSMFENAAGLSQQQQAIQQQINYLQQLHAQQQLSAMQTTSGGSAVAMDTSTTTPSSSSTQPQSQKLQPERSAKLQRNTGPVSAAAELEDKKAITVQKNLPLLSRDSAYGNRLRSYYHLSVDELFGLPHIPSDEDYVESLDGGASGMTAKTLPKSHKSALQAARFAEIALGALVHNEVSLAMELSNASVSRLKQCIVMENANRKFLYEVARAYFLLGCFRAFRGDMERYLKYRRVCMQHVSQIEDSESDKGPQLLVAAISYLDCWSYMVHNADENKLPSIDDSIPRLENGNSGQASSTSAAEKEYGVCFATNKIVSDPQNQNWMQGAPPIFLNNEAPLNARSLDALSCAFRSCCDQANGRFAQMAEAVAAEQGGGDVASAQAANGGGDVSSSQEITATTSAVMAHENELCSRNMVLSAFTLLQQYESATTMPNKNQGLHLIISAMDAFLENGDEDESGGFTDSQIQSLLSVCNTTIENPFLLHHGGPTYHMISNAAILLCHLLNGMHAMRASWNGAGSSSDDGDRAMEAAVFEEVYDTFISVRKLLNIHRRKLPVKLRCHGIPRPSMEGTAAPDKPFIDLGETLMCGCRGCQGFVLMACSPCVAAERARSANMKREIEVNREGGEDQVELDKDLNYLEAEFDLDDDALLNMLSRIISN